jgi:tRNA threonylcarbamoyladenosine biosynthesis protein TsaB
MKILALETSGLAGEVALLSGGELVAERMLDATKRTAQTLAPAIQQLLSNAGWTPQDVQLVAVTIGPGSFTGLRIGVTTAKTFAYAVGCQAIGIDTLETIAAQAPLGTASENHSLWAVLDAQRGQLYAARFEPATVNKQPAWQLVQPAAILDADEFLASLSPADLVTGGGLTRLLERLPPGPTIVDSSLWHPRAATVGKLAWRDYQNGRRDDFWTLSPRYLRPSAAEEKRPG